MFYEVEYISTACNPAPNCAHWGKNGLICYAASNSVLIYDTRIGGGKIIDTLIGHKKKVKAVRWITGNEHETELISVSDDNNVIVWSLADKVYIPTVLTGHNDSVNVVDAQYINSDKKTVIIATASADGFIKIWKRHHITEFVLFQDIKFDYSICIGLRLMTLPHNGKVLMATTFENSCIDLYIEEDEKFVNKKTLTGHEDWVQGLDFHIDEDQNILLASCSQDAFVRVWKFTQNFDALTPLNFDNEFESQNVRYTVSTVSVIMGHEGWVYSANWSPNGKRLVTASMDKTIIIWEYDNNAEMWLEGARMGEVGGNTLGFYGCMFSPDGDSIMAYGYHGAFHIWQSDEHGLEWEPQVTVGGHFDEVVDLAWDPKGEYLMSVSYDQTTRIHAPWKCEKDDQVSWHEIARPQVHGYDLGCLALIDRYHFASGAEEKIIRTFEAPVNFVENFKRICHLKKEDENYVAPKGASVPSLGLSNKAIYDNDNIHEASIKDKKSPYPEESHFTAVVLNAPPTEETLLQNTLWPETQKLYGHGYEVYSLSASSDGKYLVSSCKATTPEHASLILWDIQNWQIIQKLQSHTLTVAQIAFSPDNNYILSVSRDRRWTLFKKKLNCPLYELDATTNKSTGIHTRIIWTCAWSHDSKYFATGSRDGKVVVWQRNEKKQIIDVLRYCEASKPVLSLKDESVTALAFAPRCVGEDYLIAIGLETGKIHIYKWSLSSFNEVAILDSKSAHHKTVKKLAFRPMVGCAGHKSGFEKTVQLASCSCDNSVKIYNINTS